MNEAVENVGYVRPGRSCGEKDAENDAREQLPQTQAHIAPRDVDDRADDDEYWNGYGHGLFTSVRLGGGWSCVEYAMPCAYATECAHGIYGSGRSMRRAERRIRS